MTKIKIDWTKGKPRSKRISVTNKEIANLLEIGDLTVSNVLNKRFKENDFIINSCKEIDKNVKL